VFEVRIGRVGAGARWWREGGGCKLLMCNGLRAVFGAVGSFRIFLFLRRQRRLGRFVAL
jgi:hypothetical protein